MIKFFFQFHFSFGIRKKQKHGKRKLKEAYEETLNRIADSRSVSTMLNYQTALRSLLNYTSENILVSDVNRQLIEGYQRWLLDKHIALNTISCYMRSLRSLLKQLDDDIAVDEIFKTCFRGNTRTAKRALTIEDIQMLHNLSLKPSTPLCLARDIFIFSFCSLGMPFVDIAFLRKDQIRDGYISYQRHKTGQTIRFKIEETANIILSSYSKDDSPYAFPLLKKGDMHEYQVLRSRYNRQLRILGEMIHLRNHLTSYVSRHSWASIAYQQNTELSIISKAMGHTSPNTTLIYIREINDDRIDEANQHIIEQMKR